MGAALLRVRSARAPYRRGGIEFGSLPLVLGREHFTDGIDGLRQLVAIVTDPVLRVAVADADTPDQFEPVPDEMRAALVDALRAVEVAENKSTLNEAIAYIVAGLIGEKELQSPEDAEDEDDDAAASESDAGAKADGGTDAAPAVEPPPASDASAASGEQSRAGADASGAAPAADADAGKQPGDAQQPPVADGTARPAPPAGDAANPAAAAPAVPADTEPKKGGRGPGRGESQGRCQAAELFGSPVRACSRRQKNGLKKEGGPAALS